MGNLSVQAPSRLLTAVASACATKPLGDALAEAVAALSATGATVAAWTKGEDGWANADAAGQAPEPESDHDWIAVQIGTGGATQAVLMMASQADEDRELLEALAGILNCAAQRDAAEARTDGVSRRFADNQRISGVGSYDWHIATDTNIWTDKLFRIYGCEPGSFEPSYQQFIDRIHPDDREHIRAVHAKAYEEGGSYEMHERIVWPDGSIHTLWSMGEVICDEDGTPVRMVGVCEDVTEALIEQERTRRALADVARSEAERAAALELNDNVVQGLTAVAWALDAGHVEPATAAARRTLQAARDMMDRLLDFSSKAINPGDLVRTTHAPRVMEELHTEQGRAT